MESGTKIFTDAPKDNQGNGDSFSPTDLVAAALGACMMTIMGIMADRDGIDLTGMSMQVEKHMSDSSPRRIASLPLIIRMPQGLTAEQRTKLERGAATCPVHHSLHPEIKTEIQFLYDV